MPSPDTLVVDNNHVEDNCENGFISTVPNYNADQQNTRHGVHFPIAVIGIGCRLPGDVNGTSDFWDVISNGRHTITEIPKERWSLEVYHSEDNRPGTHLNKRSSFVSDVFGFDNSFFKISPREATMMDPQQRHLLEVTYEAFADAGIVPEKLQERCGVYVGIGTVDYLLRLGTDKRLNNAYRHTGLSHSVAANRISYVFNLRGPSMAVDTACASSMTSTHLACRALWGGECEIALTSGSNVLLMPEITVGFSQLGVLSSDGRSCPFDESAKGYVRGEGWGTVVLKPLHTAVRDNDHIYCVITGSSVGDCGQSPSITMPSADAQQELLEMTYKNFNIPLSEVDYIEAHGTGTPVGDPIEAKAISAVFKGHHEGSLKIGSVKGNFGHLECAAGIVSVIKASLMLEKRILCPSANFKKANPQIDLDNLRLNVLTSLERLPDRKKGVIGVNSFGFGGALAHMIFEENPVTKKKKTNGFGWKFGPSDTTGNPAVIPLSAKSTCSLIALVSKWSQYECDKDSQGIIGFISSRQKHFSTRAAFIAESGKQFRYMTENFSKSNSTSPDVIFGSPTEQKKLRICMVFPGQGQQWADMGRYLFKTEPVFQEKIRQCDNVFTTLSGYSILSKYGVFTEASNGITASENVINMVEISQPSILFFQIALFSLWKHWGVRPDVVVGHSLGEVASAFAAERLTLEDAVSVIYHRSTLQAQFVGKGAMAAYRASSNEAMQYCKSNQDIYVACINAPTSVTLAGDTDIIQELAEKFPSQAKRLRVQCAFHTPHMEPMKESFLQNLLIQPLTPTGNPRFYSTVTGDVVNGVLDVQYWWDNIRSPVDFLAATTKILGQENIDMFIECSAAATLMSCVSQTAKQLQVDIPLKVMSCLRDKDDRISLLRSLATVYVHGGDIDWANVNHNNSQWAPVPTYAWDHVTFQEESEVTRKNRLGLFDRTFVGQHGVISTDMFPYLADHVVNGYTLFPGAGYIEYALQRVAGEFGNTSLEQIQFEHVFILPDGGSEKLHITVEGSVIRMTTQDGVEHAQVILSHLKGNTTKLPLDEIRNCCNKQIDVQGVYEGFKEIGLGYGRHFQVIKELYVSDGEAVAFMTCPPNSEHAYIPTVDGCFQLALLAAGFGTTTYLPVKIAAFNMHVNNIPTNETLVAFAQVTDHSYEYITADIFLAKENGEVLVEIHGFEAKNVSGTKTDVDIHTCLYTTEWQPKSSGLPSPNTATNIFSRQNLEQMFPDEMTHISRVEPHMSDLEDIAVAYAHHALSQVPEEEWMVPRNTRYIHRLQQMVTNHQKPLDMITCHNQLADLQQNFPEMEVELRLIEKLGAQLPQTLKDPSGAVSILFGPGALASYFNDSLTTRLYYKACAELVRQAFEAATKRKRILRILEISGRMGGLAHHVLKACSKLMTRGHIEYVFTNLDTTFSAHAQQSLADFPHVKYRQLDIERDVASQGFVLNSFDIVIGMDALHLVADIQASLTNITNLLCENGWLMMVEKTNGFLMPEIVFGALERCWVYEDDRFDTCWLTQKGWADQFSTNGLENVTAVSTPNEFFHSIILGQKTRLHPFLPENIMENKELWIVYGNESSTNSVVDDALSSLNVDVLRCDTVEKFETCLATTEKRKCNIVYSWNRNDTYLAETLNILKEAVKHSGMVKSFWVLINGGEDEPLASLPSGFVRVATNEISNFPIFSLQIRLPVTTISIDNIKAILQTRDSADRDLIVQGEQILVPRLLKNDMIQEKVDQFEKWTLAFPTNAKHLDDIDYYQYTTTPLDSNKVLVEVKAAGVNFKDVMMTTGLLEGLDLLPQFGIECSGIIKKITSDVRHFYVGDEVIAFGDHCFASHVVCDANLVVKKPENMSTTDASGVAIVYTTAYHALVERARLCRDESVLIHSACGGVGQAAIQIARMIGAKIYCSAGSELKREFLRNTCEVSHVTDSHSMSFADDILQWTNGEGVDVILNSLSGDFIKRGIESLKPGGRFCEIGKRDILSNSSIQMQSLLENKSFISVQMDILSKQRPSEMNRILKKVCSLFENETIRPMHTEVRPISEYKETFRWMMTGKHVGKIVFEVGDHFQENVVRSKVWFKPDVTYLVTGGMGGIGQALIRWMVENGARHIAIMSRSGAMTRLQKCTLNYLVRMGATVYDQVVRCDVSSLADVTQAMQDLLSTAPALKGVFHLAAVIDDNAVVNIASDQLKRGIRAKAFGAIHLHECTKHLDLDYFVMLSSFSAVIGNQDQASYCAANSVLDALAIKRRKEGLVGLSVQLGAIRGAGFLEGRSTTSKILHSKGFKTLHIAEYLDMIGRILQQPDAPPVIGLSHMDWETVIQFCHKDMRKFQHLVSPTNAATGDHNVTKDDFMDKFITKLGEILYVAPDAIDTSRPMIDYGVDSLLAVDMVNWVNKEFGLSISQLDILGGVTTDSLLEKALEGKDGISF